MVVVEVDVESLVLLFVALLCLLRRCGGGGGGGDHGGRVIGDVDGSGYSPYVLYVLLSVAVQSAVDA